MPELALDSIFTHLSLFNVAQVLEGRLSDGGQCLEGLSESS